MQRQDIDFEQVYDIFAVRIVIDSQGKSLREQKSDCWKAYNGITSTYRPHPERLRDWLSVPKANGYMALHTTVMGPQGRWVEVQIRSEEMDEAAEKGLAAHWRYKETGSMADASFEQWLDKIRDLLENQQMSAQDFVHEVKSSLVNEEIYVFTPKGDLKILPSGATVLDFAYHIHTNLGDTCIGAKVNQKLEPQNYQLKNGDQVEVISSPRQQPVEEWLNYTVTSRAKSKIKESLKEQRRTIAARGKEIFDRKARQYNVDENHQAVKELLAEFRIPTINDLYYRLGNRQIDVQRLSDFIYRKQNQREVYDQYQNTADYAAYRNREFNDFLQRTLGHDADGLIIDDYIKAASYTFAGCCNPIPGDEIIGFVDPEAGVYIHRTNCQEAMELMSSFGSKVVKANWGAENFVEFLAGIRIIGEDYKGMLNKIVRVISLESRKNIRGFTIDSGGGTFEGQIKLYVNDTEDLHKVMKELERIKGVHGVSRLTSSHQRHH
jgi:GTP pyrophosphokinase